MPRYKKFTFTFNNYTDKDIVDLKEFASRHLQYIKYGKEIGASGTPHLQGYLITKKEEGLKTVIAMIPGKPHIEIMRGTLLENEAYTSKDGIITEQGQLTVLVPNLEHVILVMTPYLSRTFTSTTTTGVKDLIKKHKKFLLQVVMFDCPIQYIRHRAGIKQYLDDYYQDTAIYYAEQAYFTCF